MEEEILACIKEEDVKYLEAGQISKYVFPMPREKAHKKNVAHLIVRIFIMSITPEGEIEYLVQKRSKNKRSYPEYLTDSASGHVEYKEKIDLDYIRENALRELHEEFGISSEKVQKVLFQGLEREKDNLSPEIAYIFYGLVDYDVELRPDPEELETEGSKFYKKSELEGLMDREDLVDYSREHWIQILNTDIIDLFQEKEKEKIHHYVGLFIGRFQPFHLGHLFVIEEIMKNYEKVKIGIGSSQRSHTKNDPFTAEERTQFIQDTLDSVGLISKYEIFEIPDIFNAEKWVNHVVSIVGYFDEIFSNSEWVRELFKNKGYHVGKELEFKMEEINATRIRRMIANEEEEWQRLVPEEVELLIKKFDGIERLKSLYNENEET